MPSYGGTSSQAGVASLGSITVAFAAMYHKVKSHPCGRYSKHRGSTQLWGRSSHGAVDCCVGDRWRHLRHFSGQSDHLVFRSDLREGRDRCGTRPRDEAIRFSGRGDLALASSCVGLLVSVILGMALVNYAARDGPKSHG